MPKGVVPTDAKNLLEHTKTRLKTNNEYFSLYIRPSENHTFAVVSEPDTKKFSQSDIEILYKEIAVCKNYIGNDLSDVSHKFPEWTFKYGFQRGNIIESSRVTDINAGIKWIER